MKSYGGAAASRSAYAKASAFAEATAAALCAMAVKMADKLEDKYEIGGEGVARQFCRSRSARSLFASCSADVTYCNM